MPSCKNKNNTYICGRCGHRTVTVNRNGGMTPFLIGCTGGECTGHATSSFYSDRCQDRTPTHEWVLLGENNCLALQKIKGQNDG